MKSKNKIALFTSCNENYVIPAIISFKSFEERNPDVFNYYIIGSSFSKEYINLLESNNIKYLNENLYDEFRINNNWPYPSECFWFLKGPNLFNELGYEYSMSIDPDVFCIQQLDLNWLNQIQIIAGSTKKNDVTVKQFLSNFTVFKKIDNEFLDFKKRKDVTAISAGVLFFNNKNYVHCKLYELSIDIFKRSKKNGIERKGDDSLLNLILYLTDNSYYYFLDKKWNNYFYFDKPDEIAKSYILHGYSVKPWNGAKSTNPTVKYLYDAWNKTRDSIPSLKEYEIYWYREKHFNFGDELTPWLISKLLNTNLEKPCDPKFAKNTVLLGAGSIMRLSNYNTEIWGCGIRNVNQNDFKIAKKYHAVRGPFTRRQILRLGGNCPEIFGDPGMLVPLFYCPRTQKKYKLGIIPHYVDYKKIQEKYGIYTDIKVIDLRTNNIESIIYELLECESTISSSLHGLIISVAYGLPTRWVKFSNKINGDGIKFYDFFASIDRNVFNEFDFERLVSNDIKYNPLNIEDDVEIYSVLNKVFIYKNNDLDIGLLLRSFPLTRFNLTQFPKVKGISRNPLVMCINYFKKSTTLFLTKIRLLV